LICMPQAYKSRLEARSAKGNFAIRGIAWQVQTVTPCGQMSWALPSANTISTCSVADGACAMAQSAERKTLNLVVVSSRPTVGDCFGPNGGRLWQCKCKTNRHVQSWPECQLLINVWVCFEPGLSYEYTAPDVSTYTEYDINVQCC
jgi:hypothetical protein